MAARTAKFRRRSFTLVLLICVFVPEVAADCPRPKVNFRGVQGLILTDETIVMKSFPDGVVITLECGHGHFHASGSGTVTCVDGKWAEPDMVCKKRDCGPPKPMPNMSFNISGGTLFGAVTKATCDKGYRIQGVSYMECYASGWKGRASCHMVTCPLPVEVTNGAVEWVSSEKPKYGDVVEYSCDDGYTLVGHANLRCTGTGKYDAEPPKCEDLRVATTNSEDPITVQTAQTTPIIEETTATAAPTTADRDKSLASPATPRRGNRGAVKPSEATNTSDPSAALDIFGGSVPVVITVAVVILLIGLAAGIVLYKFLLRRKGGSFSVC